MTSMTLSDPCVSAAGWAARTLGSPWVRSHSGPISAHYAGLAHDRGGAHVRHGASKAGSARLTADLFHGVVMPDQIGIPDG